MVDLEEIKLLCKRIIDWELTPVDSGTAHQLAHKTIDLISEVSRLQSEQVKLGWWRDHGQKLRNAIAEMDGNAISDQALENAPIKIKGTVKRLQELVRVQKEYITYLEEIYGMRTSRRATELRSQIKELEKEI